MDDDLPTVEPRATWHIPGIQAPGILVDAFKGRVTVFVGPNGSGKSALGDWLRRVTPAPVKRIMAHRQLWFESSGGSLAADQRQNITALLETWESHVESRWRDGAAPQRPGVVLFDLLAKHHERNSEVLRVLESGELSLQSATTKYGPAPLDVISSLLTEAGLPMSLQVRGASIVSGSDGAEYDIARMSDGEKSAILLAAEAYLADPGAVLIVDEPERHLHRSISGPVIEGVMASRSDCHFVVLTHDLELASSLSPDLTSMFAMSQCVWDSGNAVGWDVHQVPDPGTIPNSVRAAILGGRRKVLFVEGDSASLDLSLYRLLFPQWPILPAGGCEEVIRATKGLTETEGLHWVEARGVVDGDRRSLDEVNALQDARVLVLKSLEVESLYFSSTAIRAAADSHSTVLDVTADELYGAARSAAIEALDSSDVIEHLASVVSTREVRRRLLNAAPNNSRLKDGENQICIVVDSPFESEKQTLRRLVSEGKLDEIVRGFPVKDSPLPSRVAAALRFKNVSDYESAVRRAVKSDEKLMESLRELAGRLP